MKGTFRCYDQINKFKNNYIQWRYHHMAVILGSTQFGYSFQYGDKWCIYIYYLHSFLCEEARSIISGLAPTSSNYAQLSDFYKKDMVKPRY